MPLDLEFARHQFPALKADDFIYFDNAGGALVLGRVAERIRDYLVTSSVQIGASYSKSALALKRLREAEAGIARLIGAARPEEIIMGASTTMLLQMLAGNCARTLGPGDEIIVSGSEHESNFGPWELLETRGIKLIHWPVEGPDHALEPATLKTLLTDQTKLVCFTHVSNILGAINPVAEITQMVHEAGAKVVVDGVAYAAHRLIEVAKWGVDFYVFSFYKAFGPHHAALYGRAEHLLALPGNNHKYTPHDKIPYKFQPGNPNYELSWGALGILDYLIDLGQRNGGDNLDERQSLRKAFEHIAAHEEGLATRLLDFLNSRQGVSIIGPDTADKNTRVAIISFKIAGKDSREIVAAVDSHNIGIRHGDFHARRLIESLGLAGQHGIIRVSMAHYNRVEEVDRLIAALEPVI